MNLNLSFLARQKFRFDLGQSFLTVVNFAFVVVAASGTLAQVAHVRTRTMVAVVVPAAVAGVWLLGYALDRLRFSQAYQEEQNRRNEMLKAVCGRERSTMDGCGHWVLYRPGQDEIFPEHFVARTRGGGFCRAHGTAEALVRNAEEVGAIVEWHGGRENGE
jgi:hypothetical protein